jgi:hypothetical protein
MALAGWWRLASKKARQEMGTYERISFDGWLDFRKWPKADVGPERKQKDRPTAVSLWPYWGVRSANDSRTLVAAYMRKIADSREAKDQHSQVEGSGTAIMVSVPAGLYVSGNPSLLKAKDDSEAGKQLQELCGAITGDRKQRRREHDRDRSIGARRQAVDAGSHDVHWAARVEWRSPAGYWQTIFWASSPRLKQKRPPEGGLSG